MLICINFCMDVLGFTSSYPNILGSWIESNAAGSGSTQVELNGNFVGTNSVSGAYSMINTFIVAVLASLAVGTVLSILTGGFSIMYILPTFVSIYLVDLILRTTSFLSDATMPPELGGLLFSIIAVMALVIVISFIRGSEP